MDSPTRFMKVSTPDATQFAERQAERDSTALQRTGGGKCAIILPITYTRSYTHNLMHEFDSSVESLCGTPSTPSRIGKRRLIHLHADRLPSSFHTFDRALTIVRRGTLLLALAIRVSSTPSYWLGT